ncbi:programmed cell death protein 2 [Myxozyma melibiosi]|uniref:Programmed cell death protein 2 n=1 Tax=Myxozyma melibiosi TaxID=54550 RepID=A0ABR1EYP5_9ASCO
MSADYDSDSDASVVSQTGKTSTLLGYPDEPADATATALDTRIGGLPIWLNPDSPPSASLARCQNCKKIMNQLIQAYAALDGTLYERVVYLFACKEPRCRRIPGSARVFRGVMHNQEKMKRVADNLREEEEKKKRKAEEQAREVQKEREMQADIGGALFGSGFGDNPFATPTPSSSTSTLPPQPTTSWSNVASLDSSLTDSLAKTHIDSTPHPPPTPEPWPEQPQDQYMPYFLYVENEYLPDKSAPAEINQRFELLDANSSEADEWSSMPESGAGGADGANAIDKVFQKFADTVAENPEQVVRYERAAAPLLYSKSDAVARQITSRSAGGAYSSSLIPRCSLCGGERVFEFQLMPHAIQVLEESSGVDMLNGMEWGTIIVATCKQDCVPPLDKHGVGYAEEWIGVQWEETRK